MNKIEIGKYYNVRFEMLSAWNNVKLLHIPNATGDTWRFETKDGHEIAIGYFACMEPVEAK